MYFWNIVNKISTEKPIEIGTIIPESGWCAKGRKLNDDHVLLQKATTNGATMKHEKHTSSTDRHPYNLPRFINDDLSMRTTTLARISSHSY